MKHVKKSVLLWYSAHEIYELVVDVESYPKFLPWCERAEILERNADGLTARLHLAYSGLRHAFTTRNVHVPDRSVQVALVDGPFSQLDGLWRFVPLPVPGADAHPGTAERLQDRVRAALRLRQRPARRRDQPGVRPDRRHLRRFLRPPRRAGLWRRASGAPVLHVAVAWSARPGEAREVGVELPAGAERARRDPRQRRDGRATVRSTSRPRRSASGAGASALDAPLADGDRVEIYRPLQMDPKEARAASRPRRRK